MHYKPAISGNGERMSEQKDFGFSDKARTTLCLEKPSAANPYLTETLYLAGYDLQQLVQKRSFSDTLYLLFRRELPNAVQSELLEKLMTGLICASPRHAASRAVISAGISKTNPEHLLPIGLLTLGGKQGGAAEVQQAYKLLQQQLQTAPDLVLQNRDPATAPHQHPLPGFGSLFGDPDPLIHKLAEYLLSLEGAGPHLRFGQQLADLLTATGCGWLDTGLCAAVCADLGFGERESVALYQFFRSPGLIALGMEQSHLPIQALPLLEDQHYVFERK